MEDILKEILKCAMDASNKEMILLDELIENNHINKDNIGEVIKMSYAWISGDWGMSCLLAVFYEGYRWFQWMEDNPEMEKNTINI